MRRGIALVVALCGCNEVFKLQDTQLVDAAPTRRDAMVDAQVTCPPPGTVPKFSKALTQVLTQDCYGFSASTTSGIALAGCYAPVTYTYSISEGQLDGDLVPARGFPDSTKAYISTPHLTPEGDEVYLSYYDYLVPGYTFRSFRRQADGTWAPKDTLPIPATGNQVLSGPSRGPERHMLVANYNLPVDEYVLDPGTGWTLQRSLQLADLGMTSISTLQLSADGLRVLIYGQLAGSTSYDLRYADRPTQDAPFGMGAPTGLPQINEAFMTEDCARIYFPALGSIFYATLQDH